MRKRETITGLKNIVTSNANILKALEKTAPTNEYTLMLRLIENNYSKYVTSKDAIKKQRIVEFISDQSLQKSSEKKYDKLYSKHKRILDKYPLLKVQSDYTIRNNFTHESIGVYLTAMQLYYSQNKP